MPHHELARGVMPDGHIAIVKYDECPTNPRQTNDNLGIAYIFDRRLNIADSHNFSGRAEFLAHQASLPARHPDKMLEQYRYPIHCYEHGGVTLSLRPTTPAGSIIGVTYTTRKRIRDFGLRPNADAHKIHANLEAEMHELDAYAKGEIYAAKVYPACPHCRQPHGEPAISYGGILADRGAEQVLEYLAADFPAR